MKGQDTEEVAFLRRSEIDRLAVDGQGDLAEKMHTDDRDLGPLSPPPFSRTRRPGR